MKATLEYNLPEDQNYFEDAANGYKYKHILAELDQQLRSFIKYGNQFKTVGEALEHIRLELHNHLKEAKIDIYD